MRLILAVWLCLGVSVAVAQIPSRCDQWQRPLTRVAQYHWGLDAPISVMGAQIRQESACRPDARSKYAAGLAQFTPPTASDMRRWYKKYLGDFDLYDPHQSITALVLYDQRLMSYIQRKHSVVAQCDLWAMTLSAYNGGAGWVNRDVRLCRKAKDCDPSRWWGHVERYTSRAGWARKENRHYPKVILKRWQPLFHAAGWGGPQICIQG